MKCEKCGDPIEMNNTYRFKGRKVCDDCYIDLVMGVPDVDITGLPLEIRCGFLLFMKNWHRDRPNRHHIRFPGSGPDKKEGLF